MKSKHLLFYDGECGLCDRCVQFVLKHDKNHFFMFAPLQGKTAKGALSDLSHEQKSIDSMILIENYQTKNQRIYLRGQAALRVFWHVGGAFSLLGVINFLPAFLYNWVYDIIAHYRHSVFPRESCRLPQVKDNHYFLD